MQKKCEEKCTVYSRVVGYYSPTNQWNKGKKEEYRFRKTFKANEASKEVSDEQENDVQGKSCFAL